MADEHRDMEGWGVYSIFKEAKRLLYQHIRILRPFIFAFLLPLALNVFLEAISISWLLTWVDENVLRPHLGSIFGHHRHSGFHAAFVKGPDDRNPIPLFVIELLLITYTLFLTFTLSWLLVSLAAAGIAKAIHHIYSSDEDNGNSSQTQTQTQIQSIFASLPHSLYRIFILSLCFFVVDIFTYFLFTLPFFFISESAFDTSPGLDHLQTWSRYLVFLTLDFWFLVSVQVVVLDSHYDGWAALRRSAKLVKAKAKTGLGLVVVYFVFFCVLNVVVMWAITTPAHSVVLYVGAGALALGYFAFAAFWMVAVTVFYFVSKRKWSAGGGGGGEEGREAEGDSYEALDVVSGEVSRV